MKKCHICGGDKFTEKLVKETFEIEGKIILVEDIPAQVCDRCGEITFSSETSENIRLIVNGNRQPTKSIKVDVFAFSID
jgi:YgiT-type zinc finger domain-containing protein